MNFVNFWTSCWKKRSISNFSKGLLIDTEVLLLLFLQDGTKPIQVAAASGSREAVEALLPVTERIQSVPEWSVDGVIEFVQSEYKREQVLNLWFFKDKLLLIFVFGQSCLQILELARWLFPSLLMQISTSFLFVWTVMIPGKSRSWEESKQVKRTYYSKERFTRGLLLVFTIFFFRCELWVIPLSIFAWKVLTTSFSFFCLFVLCQSVGTEVNHFWEWKKVSIYISRVYVNHFWEWKKVSMYISCVYVIFESWFLLVKHSWRQT